MLNKEYGDLRKAWAKAAKETGNPEDCTALTVEAMEAKGDKLGATGRALVELLKLAPTKRQLVYCMGCRYAILPNDPVESIDLAMTGCIHCYKKSPLYDGIYNCNPCRSFQRRRAYLSDVDFHLMRDKVIF
jgi:hypothetical protein